MELLGISINYKTSPIEIREAVNLSEGEITEFVSLLKKELFTSGYILSTCNRTEIFGFPKTNDIKHHLIIDNLKNYKNINGIKEEYVSKYSAFDALNHILRVATGLDSMMLGDSQIFGQTKNSFKLAEDIEFVNPVLQRIFNTAIVTGKRAINETKIGEGATSISYAAVQLVEKIFSNLSTKKALVIGAGETSELVIQHLKSKETRDITITNRTLSKADELAVKYQLKVLDFNSFKESLSGFDIILSATSSDLPLVLYDDILSAMKKRRGNPICITDIAIPRDFDPKVSDIENVFYNDIDSLNGIIESNLQKRKNEIPKVEKIIEQEMNEFQKWYNSLQIVPTIKSLRSYFEEVRLDEMKKIKNKLPNAEYDKVEDMTRRMLIRLLGAPTAKLREISENGTQPDELLTYSLVIKELYNLNGGASKE